uniref:Si:dkey-42p14.3 n=1 Tax=Poecilia latipinna TaxID=48699 RepID=A0A3B3VL94_9TELE
MSTQRERDAKEYLKKHKIFELMDNMTSMLLFYRPENPKEFLIEQLELLKVSRESGMRGPNLFDNSNLTAICGIMDPANQKYISFAQYKQGEWCCWSLLGSLKTVAYLLQTFFKVLKTTNTCLKL